MPKNKPASFFFWQNRSICVTLSHLGIVEIIVGKLLEMSKGILPHIRLNGRVLKRFIPYYKKYTRIMVMDLFCAALTTICEMVLPLILRYITDVLEG